MDPTQLPSFPEFNAPERLLLGPGPSTVPPRVRQAMAAPVIGHLDPVFVDLMCRTQVLLRYLFQTDNELTLPISGTGSAAMQAAIANMVEPGDAVLVCINGFFGGRMAEMARRYGADVTVLERPWGEVFSAEDVALALDEKPASLVAIVHGETSTGVAQPLEAIAEVVHAHNALLIADTVASLGGIPVYVDGWGIDVCYSGSQKCLSVPPGASPITLSPAAVNRLESRRTPVADWYLDLSLLRSYWGEPHRYHHTAPISTMYALYEGLRLVTEEGLEARWERHQDAAEALWQGLGRLGIALHVSREHRLASLTTACVPDGVDEANVRRRLLADYDIEIAGGLGELAGRAWRIGLMGHSAQRKHVLMLLSALEQLV
jgi:alanine-glyoxylate transaminase / serine-glyoxylate transaminase / serine-pyruvate transaminase